MEARKIIVVINILAALLLLVGVSSMPYGYYTFLRLFTTVIAVANIYFAYENKSYIAVLMGVSIAILFNPLIPVYLQKETWVILDLTAAVLLIVNIFLIKSARVT